MPITPSLPATCCAALSIWMLFSALTWVCSRHIVQEQRQNSHMRLPFSGTSVTLNKGMFTSEASQRTGLCLAWLEGRHAPSAHSAEEMPEAPCLGSSGAGRSPEATVDSLGL